VLGKYKTLGIGVADASIVVLAERHGTRDVLTLDQRHFRALRTTKGKPFRILPADSGD
jgi:predicted nucleic acid-binding protein